MASLPSPVRAAAVAPLCADCRKPPRGLRFLVDTDTIDQAFMLAAQGSGTTFAEMGWVCRKCALGKSRCPCGGWLAGMPHEWVLLDDGLIAPNPHAHYVFRPHACTNPECDRFDALATAMFRARRRELRKMGLGDVFADTQV